MWAFGFAIVVAMAGGGVTAWADHDLSAALRHELRQRMRQANERESRAFAALATRQQWENYRDQRLAKLRESLGTFPEVPRSLRIETTRQIVGDGFVIHNLLYETRPGWWVSANLYLPSRPPQKMAGILLSHSHHTGKTEGELQDMGMTWARSGVAVLVPDHLGHGERRQHPFRSAQDFDKPFRVSRQDYYFRYHANVQLSLIGDSLMGWMVWDLMRGLDVLLAQPNIDRQRLILLGAVAGGGDPAAVTAALDPRVAALVPFNFGGWQPESSRSADPDRDFPWFGDGYWESTRGLRYGARDGFAHFVIVGSIAPRKLIYAHEFAWDAAIDPAWPRLQKIFGFYQAPDALRVAHGTGSLKGRPPESSHCNHIGAIHRRMIYPVLRDWFGLPIPEEYSQRRTADELTCWTDDLRQQLRPKLLPELLADRLARLYPDSSAQPPAARTAARQQWAAWLGNVEPQPMPKVTELPRDTSALGLVERFHLEIESGIVVPVELLRPQPAAGKRPVVVMLAQAGRSRLWKEREAVLRGFHEAGAVVALVEVRGTGSSSVGASADRTSARTSLSQTSLILGQPLLGAQLRDLRTVLAWLRRDATIDAARCLVWGDSFAAPNPPERRTTVPLDTELPTVSEPGAAHLAVLAALFEETKLGVVARGGLDPRQMLVPAPAVYFPHECAFPSPLGWAELLKHHGIMLDVRDTVDGHNRRTVPPSDPLLSLNGALQQWAKR